MDTQKRAWIYTRIDAPEDTHGVLKGQEKELMDYAGRLGFSVVGGSSDLGSGMDMDRPGLARVTESADQGRFDVLLVRSLSRLGRDPARMIAFLSELERRGVEVYSPLEGKINTATLSAILSPGASEMGGHRHA